MNRCGKIGMQSLIETPYLFLRIYNKLPSPSIVRIIPAKKIVIIRPIKEIISPAIDKDLGVMNTPINDNKAPTNHTIQPNIGIHPRNNPKIENTNPVIPTPFDLGRST